MFLFRETKLLDLVSHELSDIAMNDVFDLQGNNQNCESLACTFLYVYSVSIISTKIGKTAY